MHLVLDNNDTSVQELSQNIPSKDLSQALIKTGTVLMHCEHVVFERCACHLLDSLLVFKAAPRPT